MAETTGEALESSRVKPVSRVCHCFTKSQQGGMRTQPNEPHTIIYRLELVGILLTASALLAERGMRPP